MFDLWLIIALGIARRVGVAASCECMRGMTRKQKSNTGAPPDS